VVRSDAPTEQFDAVSTAPEKNRVAFIDIGRTVAALVVFYTHIANQFIEARHGSTAVTDGFTTLFEKPLGLSSEGIGQIAIYFFFLVSGFIVTPIALKLGARRFSVNRLFRIYPLNFFAVLLSAVLVTAGLHALTAGQKPDVNGGSLLSNLTLANFSLKPFSALVGVAWTLAIEVLFYALLIAVLPLLRRWVWAAIFVELDVVLVLVLLRGPLGEGYGGVASQAAYLLIPIIGQIVWAGWHGKIPGWLAGGFLLAAWGLFVMASNMQLDVDYLLRAAPIAFAVLLFFVGIGAESRLRQRTFWTAMSERSYSLYLMHGLVALPIMHALSDYLPIFLSVLIGVAATFGVVEATYRLVERPSHNLGRRLSRRPEDGPRPAERKPKPPEPKPARRKPKPPEERKPARAAAPARRTVPRAEPETARIRPEPRAVPPRPLRPRAIRPQPNGVRPRPNGVRPHVNGIHPPSNGRPDPAGNGRPNPAGNGQPDPTPGRRTKGRHAKP
jgi:peptidoglycan/LPS O-acetylase OafA/YrhL